ncbi:MAG TPA: tRNA (adenosine(37)-N6)-threonylcarbamoyltransferase complex dimerization subunit type 1 TsaB [Caulobacteraceae bacterium]
MKILALDTCLPACSAAVLEGDRVLARKFEPMVKGHQERLATMVREVMDEAGIAFADLDRIGVTVGPGSFTGLRVGVAFAKGLSAALGIPCLGVGTLQALAGERGGLVVAAVDARRGQVYVQAFEDGRPLMHPEALRAEDAVAAIHRFGPPKALVGSGAPLLAGAFPHAHLAPEALPDPVSVARLAALSTMAARPLYLRAPDAVLPA